jgi:hypothetical protein
MRSLGSTTSVRARQMRRVLAGWQRSGLTLREFGDIQLTEPGIGSTLDFLKVWSKPQKSNRSDSISRATVSLTPAVVVEIDPQKHRIIGVVCEELGGYSIGFETKESPQRRTLAISFGCCSGCSSWLPRFSRSCNNTYSKPPAGVGLRGLSEHAARV